MVRGRGTKPPSQHKRNKERERGREREREKWGESGREQTPPNQQIANKCEREKSPNPDTVRFSAVPVFPSFLFPLSFLPSSFTGGLVGTVAFLSPPFLLSRLSIVPPFRSFLFPSFSLRGAWLVTVLFCSLRSFFPFRSIFRSSPGAAGLAQKI